MISAADRLKNAFSLFLPAEQASIAAAGSDVRGQSTQVAGVYKKMVDRPLRNLNDSGQQLLDLLKE